MIVEHDSAAHQFQVQVDGKLAVLAYRRAPGRIVFVHAEVPAAFRHRGIADALSQAGLEYARTEHLVVTALCPFVASYIRRHPEYQPLLEPGT